MKHLGRLLRISGVYSCMMDSMSEVPLEAMEYALRWSTPLEHSYFSAMEIVTEPPHNSVANRILDFLRRYDRAGGVVRRAEIHQNLKGQRSSIQCVSDLDPALEELVSRGYLQGCGKPIRSGRHGHPEFHRQYEVSRHL